MAQAKKTTTKKKTSSSKKTSAKAQPTQPPDPVVPVRREIGADRSVNYKCDEAGTALNYEVISEAVCSVRAARPLSADWKRRIDEDVQKRGR